MNNRQQDFFLKKRMTGKIFMDGKNCQKKKKKYYQSSCCFISSTALKVKLNNSIPDGAN